MGKDAKVRLAIRTVAVTTRVAVRNHERRGNAELAVASARRGLELLDDVGQSLDVDGSRRTRELFDAAHRELTALASGRSSAMTALSIEADDGTLEKDVDVGSKLGP